jgi:uncharacterized protein (TIGR02246 family)
MTESNDMTTRGVLNRLYAAYIGGDLEGMLDLFADDAVVTFSGQDTFRGRAEYEPYMRWAGTQLPVLDFRVRQIIVDGEYAAVTWDEDGRTARGEAWSAAGVDVFRIVDGKIVELTDYSDTDKIRRLLDVYPGPSGERGNPVTTRESS